jgi:hypothetical protein
MKILSLLQMQNRGYTDLSPPTMYRAALTPGMFLLAPPGGRRACRQTTKIQIKKKYPLTNIESYKSDMPERPPGWNPNNPGHLNSLSVTKPPPRCTPYTQTQVPPAQPETTLPVGSPHRLPPPFTLPRWPHVGRPPWAGRGSLDASRRFERGSSLPT